MAKAHEIFSKTPEDQELETLKALYAKEEKKQPGKGRALMTLGKLHRAKSKEHEEELDNSFSANNQRMSTMSDHVSALPLDHQLQLCRAQHAVNEQNSNLQTQKLEEIAERIRDRQAELQQTQGADGTGITIKQLQLLNEEIEILEELIASRPYLHFR